MRLVAYVSLIGHVIGRLVDDDGAGRHRGVYQRDAGAYLGAIADDTASNNGRVCADKYIVSYYRRDRFIIRADSVANCYVLKNCNPVTDDCRSTNKFAVELVRKMRIIPYLRGKAYKTAKAARHRLIIPFSKNCYVEFFSP